MFPLLVVMGGKAMKVARFGLGLAILLLGACSPTLQEGNFLYTEGRYAEAVETLREVVESEPTDAKSHFSLANAYYYKYSGDFDRQRAVVEDLNAALAHYDKAIELDPKAGEYYCERGKVHSTFSRYDEALRDFSMAVDLTPNLDRVYFNRAYLYEQKKMNSEALADFRRYIELTRDEKWKADAQRHVETLSLRLELEGKKGKKSKK